MDDDALEIALAAGMTVPEAMAFVDEPPQQPDKPGKSGCLKVLLLVVGVLILSRLLA
jgi:hypothetical protein